MVKYNYNQYVATFPYVVIAVCSNNFDSSACGLYKPIFDEVGQNNEEKGIGFAYTNLHLSSKALRGALRRNTKDMEYFPKTLFIVDKVVKHVETGLLDQKRLEELVEKHFEKCLC